MTDAPIETRPIELRPSEAFLADVLEGLRRPQKSIPCCWLYDERGSALFEAITALDDYYLTRAELEILSRHRLEIAEFCGRNSVLLDYGAGAGRKAEYLISVMDRRAVYAPIDIAGEMLAATTARIGTLFPGLTVMPVSANFAEDFDLPDAPMGGSVEFVPCADEAELLTEFWELAVRYDTIITFNGRGFDVPFLYMRSAVLNVPISRRDWLGYRYAVEPHCDLLEQLTFYNVSGREGAARRFNLDFYCKAFGLESPKAQGVTGMDVGRMLAEGRNREIAEYCLRDVYATAQLYKIWKDRLSSIK